MKIIKKLENPKCILCITILLSLVPILSILLKVFSGGVALWNDPARDLLSALDNLHKATLIGPSTGIPGVFYGPYWIWLLSFAQLISKEPGIIIFIVLTIPYLTLFPLMLSRFSKVLNAQTLAILWLLFLLTYANYFTDLWNPHPAPLLILLAIYLQFIRQNTVSLRNLIMTGVSGFAVGLVMNFQLSFGIGMLFGSIIFLVGESVIYLIHSKKILQILVQRASLLTTFLIGTVISFTPFLLFELRHYFQQTKVLFKALFHYGGGLVTQIGLTKPQIIQSFFGKIADLLHLPLSLSILILLIILSFLFTRNRLNKTTKQSFDQAKMHELKLVAIIFCLCFGVLYIYLTAKNPVWSYHFIGAEILFLLLIGIVINHAKYARIALFAWIIVLVIQNSITFFHTLRNDPQVIYGDAISEEQTVKKIQNEAHNQNYTVFAYEAGIYPYEYAYLFQTMYHKDVPYRPELNPTDSNLVFIIIPPQTKSSIKQDFINFRTAPTIYQTTGQWLEKDNTQILKRTKQIK